MAFLLKDNNRRYNTRLSKKKANKTDTIEDATAFLTHEGKKSNLKKIEFICSNICRDTKFQGKHDALTLFDYKLLVDPGSQPPVQWPSCTDLACWHCGERFDTVPISLPISYDVITQKYSMMGVYCSVNCAARYGKTHFKYDYDKIIMYLQIIGSSVWGIDHLSTIQLAPRKVFLQKYGGHLTIEEFREKSLTCTTLRDITPPFISFPIILEYNVNRKKRSNSSSSTKEIFENSEIKSNSVLNLKRPNNPITEEPIRELVPEGSLYEKYLKTKKTKTKSTKGKSTKKAQKRNSKSGFIQTVEEDTTPKKRSKVTVDQLQQSLSSFIIHSHQ